MINFNSSPGVNSVLAGVPVFVDSTSPAALVGNHDFSLIETPWRPDREQWAWNLAHTEWTVAEIKQGIPPVLSNISGYYSFLTIHLTRATPSLVALNSHFL